MIDFLALARDYNIPIRRTGHHHCQVGWCQTHCFECGVGGGYHLGFNLESGVFHCWRCGVVKAVDVLRALVPQESIGNLLQKYGGSRSSFVRPTKPDGPLSEIQAPPEFKPLASIHEKYLESRDFVPGYLAHMWGLRGTRMRAPAGWNWRVIIPIFDSVGRIVNYQGRALGEAANRPRYMTWGPEINSQLLYGENKTVGMTDSIVVVEGPVDAWRLGPGAVATLGVGWSERQASLIGKYKNRYIYFDPDNAGVKRAELLAEWLSALPGNTEILVGDVEPGDLTCDDAASVMKTLGIGSLSRAQATKEATNNKREYRCDTKSPLIGNALSCHSEI